MKKRIVSMMLCLSMVFAMTACGGTAEKKDETPAAPESTEAAGTTAAVTAEAGSDEEEAWKAEPAYGQKLYYWIGDSCTSACGVAESQGLFKEAGLDVEGFKGESDIEAVGTGQCHIAIGHIAKAAVPITNGVDVTFVGGAHLLKGCKAMYVLADSGIETYDDLVGKKISVPNGIGASDYNITSRLLLESGINPLKDVTLTPVEKEACVAAMQNGEIDAALLGESFGYQFVNEGVLKKIDSKDGNSRDELCCIIMMNKTFMEENPITSAKLASCVKKALKWMGENPEECTDLLMELGLNGEDRDQNLILNTDMEFGLLNYSEDFVTEQMRGIVEDYIEVGLITATDNVDEVLTKLWNPIGSAE